MRPKQLLIAICTLLFCATIAAQAQNVQGKCVGMVDPNNVNGPLLPCNAGATASTPGGNPSALNDAVGDASYQAGYALGAAFMNWLLSPNANATAAAQQQLQKQRMMEEIQRRQAEAVRQHQAEEAARLAAMYNRLASSLKLGGLPNLQLKTSGGSDGGLQLKLGDAAQASTLPGLPGSNATFDQHLSDLTSTTGLQLKTGNSAQSSGPPDFNKMTPQQLADLAESFSKLSPEEQQRVMAGAQAPNQQQPQVMRDFQQTLDGKSDLTRLGSNSATTNAGTQDASATGNPSGAAQPGNQPQVMRDFQQTLSGKSDLTRIGSSSAQPNAESQNSGAAGNPSGAAQAGNQPQTMRDFQQTVDGKSDLTRVGSSSVQPNAEGQNAGAAGNPSGAAQPNAQAPQGSPLTPPGEIREAAAAKATATAPNVGFDQGSPGQASAGPAVDGLKFKLSPASGSSQAQNAQAPPNVQPRAVSPNQQAAIPATKPAVNPVQLPVESDLQFLFPDEPSKWPGPKDPGFPLINPLREEAIYQRQLKQEDDWALETTMRLRRPPGGPSIQDAMQDDILHGQSVQTYAPDLFDRYQRDSDFHAYVNLMLGYADDLATGDYYQGIADAHKAGIEAYHNRLKQLEDAGVLAPGMGIAEQEQRHPGLIPVVEDAAAASAKDEEAEVAKARANSGAILDHYYRLEFDIIRQNAVRALQ